MLQKWFQEVRALTIQYRNIKSHMYTHRKEKYRAFCKYVHKVINVSILIAEGDSK